MSLGSQKTQIKTHMREHTHTYLLTHTYMYIHTTTRTFTCTFVDKLEEGKALRGAGVRRFHSMA